MSLPSVIESPSNSVPESIERSSTPAVTSSTGVSLDRRGAGFNLGDFGDFGFLDSFVCVFPREMKLFGDFDVAEIFLLLLEHVVGVGGSRLFCTTEAATIVAGNTAFWSSLTSLALVCRRESESA